MKISKPLATALLLLLPCAASCGSLKSSVKYVDDHNGYSVTPGEITLIMGRHFLINKGERKEIETYFKASAQRVLEPGKIKGRTAQGELGGARFSTR